MGVDKRSAEGLAAENENLRLRLAEAEETLEAIRSGEVDALVVSAPQGDRVFTLKGADHPYRMLVETMNEGAVTLDAGGVILYSNGRFAEMMDRALRSIVGKRFDSFFSDEDAKAIASMERESVERPCGRDVWLVKQGGVQIPVKLSCSSLDLDGVTLISVVITDLTDLVEIVGALKESEDRYALSMQAMNAAVWEWRPGGNLWISPRCRTMIGYGEQELPADSSVWLQLVHPDDLEGLRSDVHDFLARGDDNYSRVIRLRAREDGYRWIEVRTACIRGEDGAPLRLVGTNADITDRLRVEEQLRHAQRMDSVGVLAGGIAHDFNNMLMSIIGYSEHVLEELKDPELQAAMANILHASERARELTGKLLTFSRQQVVSLRPTNLTDAVYEVIRFLSRVIGEHIDVVTRISPAPLQVLGDPLQLEQVLTNLMLNARDAMPRGGTLSIHTAEAAVDELNASRLGLPQGGRFASIRVCDTGVGIPAEIRQRIFEPFFTTKGAGRGTGLGLSIAYGIIKQHHGAITVEPLPQGGTCFTVLLPTCEEAAASRNGENAAVRGGNERVLVVEDDSTVRTYLQVVLEKAGYRVLNAADGQEALELEAEFDIVLSDVQMPRMNGQELLKKLRDRNPRTRLIFMSGYSADIISMDEIAGKEVDFLQKPVGKKELLAKVREVLQRC